MLGASAQLSSSSPHPAALAGALEPGNRYPGASIVPVPIGCWSSHSHRRRGNYLIYYYCDLYDHFHLFRYFRIPAPESPLLFAIAPSATRPIVSLSVVRTRTGPCDFPPSRCPFLYPFFSSAVYFALCSRFHLFGVRFAAIFTAQCRSSGSSSDSGFVGGVARFGSVRSIQVQVHWSGGRSSSPTVGLVAAAVSPRTHMAHIAVVQPAEFRSHQEMHRDGAVTVSGLRA